MPTVKVVGIQYYNGVVHRGEWANLVREPSNPYDSNAVKVTTLNANVQVGHINRHSAATLRSTLDDRTRDKVRVECDFPSAGSNSRVYAVQARLRFWGFPHQSKNLLSRIRSLGPRMTNGGAAVSSKAGTIKKIKFDPAQAHKELDALFEKLAADNSKMKDYDARAEVGGTLVANLFPHQKKGVQWMLNREAKNDKDSDLPPFWSREGSSNYINSITNSTVGVRPKHVRGGVLADDMGLGKTLQTIAVIVDDLVTDNFIEAVPYDADHHHLQNFVVEPEDEDDMIADLNSLKVVELKALCKAHGLPLSGKKSVLIARLEKSRGSGSSSSSSSSRLWWEQTEGDVANFSFVLVYQS